MPREWLGRGYVHVLNADGYCPVCGEFETWLVENGHAVDYSEVVALLPPD